MDVLGDLVARDRRSDRPALRVDGRESYSYHDLCTTVWKAANVLRHYGVAGGRTVAVAALARPAPILTFLGAASLGAVTRFGPSSGAESGDGGTGADDDGSGAAPRAVLVPAAEESAHDLPPGSKLFVYGDRPADPSTIHWETDVWSENPAIPPYEVAADDPALAVDGREAYSHRDLLDAASGVVDEFGLDADSRVGVRGSLEHPGVVAAGLVAPLLAGGTVAVGEAERESDDAHDAGDHDGVGAHAPDAIDLAVVDSGGSGSDVGPDAGDPAGVVVADDVLR